ncbi:hypothetical protein GB937_007872 [Aspergillus fischeri]|nr:hypothetical protein GB937_007872 [Aspergillus fischeri]
MVWAIVGLLLYRSHERIWFTYSRVVTTLVIPAQPVHLGFYDRRAEILAAHDAKSLYSDSSSLETSVEFLTSQMDKIREWLRSVPDAMKTNKRKDGGEPFSTDRSRLDLERYAPSWCSANGFSSSFSTTTSL